MKRYIHGGMTLILFIAMGVTTIALWQGIIPVDWLASLNYKGIFFLSLINGVAPVAGPSQIATFFVASKLNPLAVGLAAGIGGAVGELAGYAFGYSLRTAQSEKVERKIQRIANWGFLRISRENSFIPLFVLASVPNPFFDPVSALAGSLRIGFARYFIPVLLGKTVRHLLIAYAGYYTISGDVEAAFSEVLMMIDISAVGFVAAVIGIALIAWLVRSFAESDPDPLLLNFTFFAFAGQLILTAELIGDGKPIQIVSGLDLLALILVVFQIIIVKEQVSTTTEHYEQLLKDNEAYEKDVEHWVGVLVRITGVDFFPEFYQRYINIRFLRNSRDRRRKQAVSVLPNELFKTGSHGIESNDLIVKTNDRKWLWRLYAGICLASWILFIICIRVGRWH